MVPQVCFSIPYTQSSGYTRFQSATRNRLETSESAKPASAECSIIDAVDNFTFAKLSLMGYMLYAQTVGEEGCAPNPIILTRHARRGRQLLRRLAGLQRKAITTFGARAFATMSSLVEQALTAVEEMGQIVAAGGVEALREAFAEERLIWQGFSEENSCSVQFLL